ncbi:MAG: hypothetical protein ACM3SY_17550 [Candidatus Omnitrophota bacterium]
MENFIISGNTGVGNATLRHKEGVEIATSSGSDGNYSIPVPAGWSGRIDVSKPCFGFTPPYFDYPPVDTNISNKNYIAAPVPYYIISGIITENGTPLAGVVMNGLPGNPSTNDQGAYTATVPCFWSSTVTPTKTCYTFDPTSIPYSNVYANQTQNYTAKRTNYTISGNVGVGNATLSYTDKIPKTVPSDSNGNYSLLVSCGWSGTVTVTKPCYVFTPSSKAYPPVMADKSNENYTSNLIHYRITGNTGIGGVTLSYTEGGISKYVISDPSGNYSIAISCSWSGTVTASKACYRFTPPSTPYANVQADKPGQNYIATPLTYTVSGTIKTTGGLPISGVTLSGFPQTTLTNESGQYTTTVPCGWTGPVIPVKEGYAFTPDRRNYNVTSNLTSEDYTAQRVFTLTVKRDNGALGTIQSGAYKYFEGDRVSYSFSLDPAANCASISVQLTKAGSSPTAIPVSGVITMDGNYTLEVIVWAKLTVIVSGAFYAVAPPSGDYLYRRFEKVGYVYEYIIGRYTVVLDNKKVSESGVITMDKNHNLGSFSRDVNIPNGLDVLYHFR